ncbi:alpha/beta-Hydrolase [Glarea lozoyensis ATCC 20868]|uniref:Alpha/beta-Hydrolase n=1 Tax=Glarea lozoyensis (strain ATCC 20868 / MF5171) TaxID=1116229 RepID=S3CL08_GLAL2|nr:alpha/beta-Hydrolase [Glarea lozoyensis ATCC 20868]EPE27202.1 alpha/beta-Hydrolase [Glarea lozoyensis ATCC 20868]
MDASPAALIKALVPKIPLLGKTAFSHTLGFSEQSSKWDLRTAMTINVIRSFIIDTPPSAISKTQKLTLRDPGVKGRMWISRTTLSTPKEDDVTQALFSAIETMKEPGAPRGGFKHPSMVPVEAEWTGYRSGATKASTELRISEKEKYRELMKEATSSTTVLYFHGGAYYLMDPCSHRVTCKKLAKLTKGRCLSVRYRLAPQAAFPTQLLDALVSYLNLLYPCSDAFHDSVKPEHIAFAGDSAGGNLALALLQLLLEFKRQDRKVMWNGAEREIPLPAGVATASAWCDITHSSPSCSTNRHYDYLPSHHDVPATGRVYPACDIWPTNPPRKQLYADDAVLTHPLVSPIIAKSWEGSCPIYMQTGEELLSDEDKYVTYKAAKQGVPVVYEEYEAMPHCFAMLLEALPSSRLFFDRWAGFISDVTNGREVVTKGTLIRAKTMAEETVDLGKLSSFTDEEVLGRMNSRVEKMTAQKPDQISKL